jgi:hypothetical protein
MKVLEAYWFTPMGGAIIGIVKVETEYDGIKYYIGTGFGMDQEVDARNIAERGAKFPAEAGEKLMS